VKKLKKNSKRRIVLYAIVAVVLIAILYAINNPTKITGNVVASTTGKYDFSRNNPDYYSLLPPKPDDFDQIKTMLDTGIIRDFPDRINESYWKQPEWFPGYNQSFVAVLEDISNASRIPIWSIDIYDAELYRQINKDWLESATMEGMNDPALIEIKNDSIVLRHRFWVRASVGSLQWFGVGLYESYPPQATLIASPKTGFESRTLTQDPELVKKYISVDAIESVSGSKEFNLGIYWPKLSYEYQKQVLVTVEIKKSTPKGFYVIAVQPGSPSKDYQESQSLKYGLTYTDPNIGMFVNPGTFKLFIEVA
jgi:hypothetical protein